eukprot:429399_1
MPADTNGAGTTGGPNANIMFDNENPIDIVLVLLHQYPQIETWLQSMEYHGTVTTSRTHAVQFNESDEDYGAAYPMNGGANESGSDFNPSSGRKSSPKKRRKKKRKKRHSSKRVVKEASEAEFTGGETEEEGEQIANMSGDESEDYNPGVAVGNVGSRRSDRKRRSKKRNIDQMSNGSHMTSRNKRQKTSHGPKNKNLMQYISPAPVHWKMMSCTDDGEEANSGRFRLKLKCIRHPIKEAVMRIGAHKFGLDDVLDTLCDVEQNGDEIRRSRSAKKRLNEELLQLRGCYNTKGGSAAIDSESDYNVENKFCDEFVANEFIKICQSNMDHDECYHV